MIAPDSFAPLLARWFAEATLVASALALVAHLVDRLRGLSPAVRHALWLVVLVKLMMPPIVHWPWSRQIAAIAPGRAVEAIAEVAAAVEPVTLPVPWEPATAPETLTPDESPDLRFDQDRAPRVEALSGISEAAQAPRWTWPAPGDWLLPAWMAGSATVGAWQVGRIVRFRRTIRRARPAPDWLVDEAGPIGRRLSVRVPEIREVDGLATPVLWCLGRPVLLVPSALLKTMEAGRWAGILAHELAHLRRGDPWVGRLELAAMLAWWWNPLYWLARRRIDFEAELACDAWALWAFPDDRIEYAESLVRICTSHRPARLPSPALGVAGAGQSFERRLIMILRERSSHRASLPGLLAATLLAAVAVPSWTLGAAEAPDARPIATDARDVAPSPDPQPIVIAVQVAQDDDDKDDDARKAKKDKDAKKAEDSDEAASDLEKAAEAIGAKIGEEMEKKFGPGSEFEKKMEALGEEMEKKFGPGSEFEKKMEALGKEMEEKFGPGSEFARDMAAKFGPGSKFEVDIKGLDNAKARADAAKARAEGDKKKADAAKARAVRSPDKAKAKGEDAKRARRIETLQGRIDEMRKELKQLKDAGDDDQEDQG